MLPFSLLIIIIIIIIIIIKKKEKKIVAYGGNINEPYYYLHSFNLKQYILPQGISTSGVKAKNIWSYNYTPPYVFTAFCSI
jgi:hypothetical protein